jgi:hypothetical protein
LVAQSKKFRAPGPGTEAGLGVPAELQMILHGSVVLLLGLLCGIPLGAAAARGAGQEATRALTWSLVISAYVFLLGLVVAAVADVRGLSPRGAVLNRLVFAAYVVGSAGTLLGVVLTILGAWAALAARGG